MSCHRRLALCTALLFVAVFPMVTTAQKGDPFARLDRNRDGKLTRDEIPARLANRFARLDTNRDGVVTRAEEAEFRRRKGLPPAGASRPATGQPKAAAALPENIAAKLNLPYAGTDNPRQRLDLYLPKQPRRVPLPVVVFFHGGGWTKGDKRTGAEWLAPYVASGEYAAVSVGYRLADEAVWPAQIHDAKAAVRFVRGSAAAYQLDPNRIGVWGASAGGNLAALLATTAGVSSLEGRLGKHTSVTSGIKCAVDFYGPSDLLAYPERDDLNSAASPISKLVGGPRLEHQEAARQASPLLYASPRAVPMLIVHGDKDPLVPFDQSSRLQQALTSCGASAMLIRVEGGRHGSFESPELEARVKAFFDLQLLGRPARISSDPVKAARRNQPPAR